MKIVTLNFTKNALNAISQMMVPLKFVRDVPPGTDLKMANVSSAPNLNFVPNAAPLNVLSARRATECLELNAFNAVKILTFAQSARLRQNAMSVSIMWPI